MTLYACALNRHPFQTDDFDELLGIILQLVPEPLAEIKPEFPAIFSRIISKLMQKVPDNRYQSASGLLYDLGHLLDPTNVSLDPNSVVLASRDHYRVSYDFPIEDRDKEIEKINSLLSDTRTDDFRGVIIEGQSGLGKSRLASHAVADALTKGFICLSAKGNDRANLTPFYAIREAFDTLFTGLIESLQMRPKRSVRSSASVAQNLL